jgi:hypothetical protein
VFGAAVRGEPRVFGGAAVCGAVAGGPVGHASTVSR